MTDEVTIAQPAAQQSPADTATTAAMDAELSGDTAKAAPLFDKAAVLHRRAEAAQATGEDSWRDGNEVVPLSPMPAAPTMAPSLVEQAIEKLHSRGGDHSALADEWGSGFSEEWGYARAAFKEVAASDPDLIAKVEASGLGDNPSVLKFLAKQGRLSAGLMGTMPKNNGTPMPTFIPSSPSPTRAGPSSNNGNNNGALETHGELNRLLAANPPGSQGYKINAPRISQLYGMLAGTGSVIGKGGRRV
jgi:hypothetical protein